MGTTPTISIMGQIADTNISDSITIDASGVVDGAAIANGTIASSKLASMDAITNQVLTWTGDAWIPGDPTFCSNVAYITYSTNAAWANNARYATNAGWASNARYATNAGWASVANLSSNVINGAITSNKLAQMDAMEGQVLTWTGEAWSPADAAQGDADMTTISNEFVLKSGDTMAGNLDMAGNRIVQVPTPSLSSDAVNKNYVDSLRDHVDDVLTNLNADFLSVYGGFMDGDLTLASDPSAAMHAATKQYVDRAVASATMTAYCDSRYLGREGGVLTGPLSVPALTVTGTNDWFVGADPDQTVNVVMVSEQGEIQAINDLNLRASNGEIKFKSPVCFEAGINEYGKAGTVNNVITTNGYQVTVPSCTTSSVVLVTSTVGTSPLRYWVASTNGSFTVWSSVSESNVWSFNYLVR